MSVIRYTLMEYKYNITKYWWLFSAAAFLVLAWFVLPTDRDLALRLIGASIMLLVLRFLWTIILLKEEERDQLRFRSYQAERQYSIGPVENIHDIPAYLRKKNGTVWAHGVVNDLKGMPEDYHVEQPLDMFAYRRRPKDPTN